MRREVMPIDLDREKRIAVQQWAIRTMLALGFDESEIAGMTDVDPSSISRALAVDDPRALSPEVVATLVDSVKDAGGLRLRKLLHGVPVEVVETSCDQGLEVDGGTVASVRY